MYQIIHASKNYGMARVPHRDGLKCRHFWAFGTVFRASPSADCAGLRRTALPGPWRQARRRRRAQRSQPLPNPRDHRLWMVRGAPPTAVRVSKLQVIMRNVEDIYRYRYRLDAWKFGRVFSTVMMICFGNRDMYIYIYKYIYIYIYTIYIYKYIYIYYIYIYVCNIFSIYIYIYIHQYVNVHIYIYICIY